MLATLPAGGNALPSCVWCTGPGSPRLGWRREAQQGACRSGISPPLLRHLAALAQAFCAAPARLPGLPQKLKEAKEHLARLQREAREDAGPLAERQQRLERLKAAKARIEGDMRRVDARLAGAATPGGGRGGQQPSGLEEEMNDAVGAGGGRGGAGAARRAACAVRTSPLLAACRLQGGAADPLAAAYSAPPAGLGGANCWP